MTTTSTPETTTPGATPPRTTNRDRMRGAIEPVGAAFGKVGLTPNGLTLIGFGIAIVAAWLAAQQSWLLCGLLVAFGAAFDLFDGALARATGKASKFGAFMDSTFDRWGEAVVYVGLTYGLLIIGETLLATLAVTSMASAFMVSYVRARSESLGFTPGRGMASVGLAPREVRVVILTIGLVVAGLTAPQPTVAGLGVAQSMPIWWLALAVSLALISILATVTTIQRIIHVYREAKQQEQH